MNIIIETTLGTQLFYGALHHIPKTEERMNFNGSYYKVDEVIHYFTKQKGYNELKKIKIKVSKI